MACVGVAGADFLLLHYLTEKAVQETQQHILQDREEIDRITEPIDNNYNDICKGGDIDSLR